METEFCNEEDFKIHSVGAGAPTTYHRTESGGKRGATGTPPMSPVPRRWDWSGGARWARQREENCQSSESLLSFFQSWSPGDNITLPDIS
ncbi:hypothetical protein J6590_104309, partial [Homalodisca vitripennis]